MNEDWGAFKRQIGHSWLSLGQRDVFVWQEPTTGLHNQHGTCTGHLSIGLTDSGLAPEVDLAEGAFPSMVQVQKLAFNNIIMVP